MSPEMCNVQRMMRHIYLHPTLQAQAQASVILSHVIWPYSDLVEAPLHGCEGHLAPNTALH